MEKQVLLINDLTGYGKVSLAAMFPVLRHMGHQIYNLPTALVSNTLDYGKFDILETTDYMKNTIDVWGELGFSFDAISTGFIVSDRQAQLVADYCKKQAKKGTLIFTDPIMGDEGVLYNGVSEETVSHMRKLISIADYIVPNYTEACYLADIPYRPDGMDAAEATALIDALRAIGSKSVIITSAKLDGQDAVIGYDHEKGEYFTIPFSLIPVRFAGTGDLFSAIFMGKVLAGLPMQDATKKSMDIVRQMILKFRENEDKFKGIPIETCLEVLNQ